MNQMHPHATLSDRARAAILDVFPDAEAVYLFGSAARGAARADSDIDLAVLCTRPLAAMDRFEKERGLSVVLDADVDLIDLASASTVLQCEVVVRGQRLYERDHDRVLDFEARVLSDYAALLESTQQLREGMRDRLASAR